MERINSKERKPAVYQTGPFDDVQLQEALIIIAIYAAQMDYKDCKEDVKRIEELLEHHPLFVARRKEIVALINKYVNELEVGDPDKALSIAADVLTPEQKMAGFELAVDVALQKKSLTDREERMLAALRSQLSISDDSAKRAIRDKIEFLRNYSGI